MLSTTMFEKGTTGGFVLRSPFSRVALAALIPLFLFIFSCSDSGSPTPTHKVSFNNNDETASPRITVKDVPEGINGPVFNASRAGYRFVSWNTKADGSGTKWDFTKDTVKEAITLYAQWKIGQTHKKGDPEPSAVPVQKDKAFVGWYKSQTFTDISNRMDFANQPSGPSFIIYPKFVDTTGYTMASDGTLNLVPSVEKVEIPYNVNEIAVKKLRNAANGTNLFGGSLSTDNNTVKTIFLPTRNLETIGAGAFGKTKGLTSLTIPGNVKTLETSSFFDSNLKNLTLSVGLEKIDYGAFEGTKIESVTIPSTVTLIWRLAFAGLNGPSALTSVRVEALVPPTIEASKTSDTFQGVVLSTFSITVPPGKASTYKAADGWKEYADKITEYTN